MLVLDEHERVVGRRVQLDRRPWRRRSRAGRGAAPCTCGAQRSEYASCTLSHQRCASLIAEPSSRPEHVRRRRRPARGAGAARGSAAGSSSASPAAPRARSRRRCRPSCASRARAHEAERAVRGHELRAVDEREPLLRRAAGSARGPTARERLARPAAARRRPTPRPRRPAAARGARAARGRRSRRPSRGSGRAGARPRFEALDEQLDGLDARARVALRERVRAQQHRRAHDLGRIRVADAARVAAQEAELELLGQLLGDRLRDEAAEARVDAVRVLARAVRGALDELARGAHPLARARRRARPARRRPRPPRRRRP